MSELTLQYPLDAQRTRLLLLMDEIYRDQGIPYVMVGATARDVLLHHVHGYPIGRASWDIDFAVAVPDWPCYERLHAGVAGRDNFSPAAGIAHRFIYREPTDAQSIPVDLVPFGGVADRGKIAWPPDMAVVMSILGFEETLRSALHVRLTAEVVIPVASIPGLVITKLIAWMERGAENTKDASDFRTLLEAYERAGNTDRLYDDGELMKRHDHDPDFAAAELLGHDVRSIIAPDSARRLAVIFKDGAIRERLLTHMLKGWDGDVFQTGKLEKMLLAFMAGVLPG